MEQAIQMQFSLLDPASRIMIWPLGLLIDLLAASIVAIILYTKYKKHNDPNIGDLTFSFASFIFMWLFMAAPAMIRPDSPTSMGVGIVVGHAFAYLGLAFFGRMLARLIWPKMANIYFSIIAVWGSILTIANTAVFSFPQITEFTRGFSVTVINSEGYFFWNIMPSIVVITWGFGGIYFLSKYFQKKYEKRQRIQSLILGIAFLALFAGGPFHLIVKTPFQYLILESGFAIAHILVLWGVSYRGLQGPTPATAPLEEKIS